MYSWTTLRQLLLLLLLLPVAHFVFLIVDDYRDILNPDPTVWENEVSSLEIRYNLAPPEANPLVVVGGRQVKLWRELERSLMPMPVVKAGIGSANIDDLLYYFDRLVKAYRPNAVLMVPGPGDFILRDSKSPEEFVLLVKGLASYVAKLDGQPHFYIATLAKWPRYPEHWNTVTAVNELLVDWAAADERVTLLDMRLAFLQVRGQPSGATFRSDGVNFNDWGYTQMSLLLRQQMETDYPQYF
jgi:hypothetical protein